MGGVSKILLLTEILDVIPVLGLFASSATNIGIIKSFGYSIRSYFLNRITDDKLRKLIYNTLNDYKSIYLQINQLCNKYNSKYNSNDNIKINGGNNKIEFNIKNENINFNKNQDINNFIQNIDIQKNNNHIDNANIKNVNINFKINQDINNSIHNNDIQVPKRIDNVHQNVYSKPKIIHNKKRIPKKQNNR